ncbi:MAG: DUF6057 family protein, partial [Candidatus Latescibacterota bacterium]
MQERRTTEHPAAVAGNGAHPQAVELLLLFLAAFGVYASVLDYSIVLQADTPSAFFVFSNAFLGQWLDHPGDLLLYASRFARQFFHHEWLGALVSAALVAAFGAVLVLIGRRQGNRAGRLPVFVPCLFVLALHGASAVTLGLLAAGAAFLRYMALPEGAHRQVYVFLATPVLYYVAGGYSWLFVAWVVLDRWLDRPLRDGLPVKLAYPAFALCLPWVAYRWVFATHLSAAYLHPLAIPQPAADRLFLAGMLLLPLWSRVPLGARLSAFLRSAQGRAARIV